MRKMKSLDKQIQDIIQDSVSRTMNIKVPLQSNIEERNLLLEILRNQERLNKKIESIYIKIAMMNNQIDKIPTKDDFYFWKK